MDHLTIDRDQVVARYLAGSLSEVEAAVFDEYARMHPEIYREIDSTLCLKEGLQGLRERGELETLIRERHWHRGWRYAAVAAAVLVALTVWNWQHESGSGGLILARTPTEFSSSGGRPLPIAGEVLLVRTRGSLGVVEIVRSAEKTAIAVKILPSSLTSSSRFRVTIGRVDSGGGPIQEVQGIEAGPDRLVTVYLDSSGLQPGRYALSVLDGNTPGNELDRFVLLVK